MPINNSATALYSIFHAHRWALKADYISVWESSIDFQFNKEELSDVEYRLLKKAVGPLKQSTWIKGALKGSRKVGDIKANITVLGAFKCEIVGKKEVKEELSDWAREQKEKALAQLKLELESGKSIREENVWSCDEPEPDDEQTDALPTTSQKEIPF